MDGIAKSRITMMAGLLALLMAAPVSAQKDGPEAEALEARALQLTNEGPARFAEAASLYREAAALRGEADAGAVRALMKAGKLAYYAGKERRAVDDLVKAADLALAYGDVVNAAIAYIDAAWVAERLGNDARAYELAVRGAKLSRSPLLAEPERAALASRVQGSFVS